MSFKPTFFAGARAKITVDSTVLAFATNISWNVDVSHVPVDVCGAYETIAYEPTGYKVSGALTVIRYTSNPNLNSTPGNATQGNTASNGNSIFTVGSATGAKAAFNPGNILLSSTFTVKVDDKRDAAGAIVQQAVNIENCRFERRSGAINAKGLLEEQFTFNGILLSDDAATVSGSQI